MKKCGKCKIEKKLTEFGKLKRNKDGLRTTCKTCRAKRYQENKEAILKDRKIYYKNNKVKISKYNKSYRENTKVDGFALYYLPEEHYVGFTNHLKLRMRSHKNRGRITEGYEIIGVYSCPIYTHLLETKLHLMGYNGFQHKY